jgi:N-glycosylase/DNA lyase
LHELPVGLYSISIAKQVSSKSSTVPVLHVHSLLSFNTCTSSEQDAKHLVFSTLTNFQGFSTVQSACGGYKTHLPSVRV